MIVLRNGQVFKLDNTKEIKKLRNEIENYINLYKEEKAKNDKAKDKLCSLLDSLYSIVVYDESPCVHCINYWEKLCENTVEDHCENFVWVGVK